VDWVLLSNALIITNGQILMRDVNATNRPVRYYRIVKHKGRFTGLVKAEK
jgi:hypothetical protein